MDAMSRPFALTALTFSIALVLAPGTPVFAGSVAASSCAASAVQIAINGALNGDVVTIPAGACTWTTKVTIPSSKGITVQGAGIDVTVITNGIASGSALRILEVAVAPSSAVTRLTGFTIDARLSDGSGEGEQIYIGGSGLDRFRIDHIRITNIRKRGIEVLPDAAGSELSGLIDHDIFEATGNYSAQGLEILGAGPLSDGPMARGFTPGTNRAVYVEDCTFNWSFQNDSAYDAYGGARYVFRFNTVNGPALIGHHGADSGGYRGVHTFEIYNNTLTNSSTTSIRLAHIRAGAGFMFANDYSGNYSGVNSGLESAVYRARPQTFVSKYGQCDGSSAWDANRGTGTLPTGNPGWPCLDQVGYTFTQNAVGAYTWNPLYLWNNRKGGVDVPMTPTETATYLVANRDYFNATAKVDGAGGVAVGPAASRPATCQSGAGYWATDEGEWNSLQSGPDGRFYRCVATNTWSVVYTPYTYPHPLQRSLASAPAAPTNLRILP